MYICTHITVQKFQHALHLWKFHNTKNKNEYSLYFMFLNLLLPIFTKIIKRTYYSSDFFIFSSSISLSSDNRSYISWRSVNKFLKYLNHKLMFNLTLFCENIHYFHSLIVSYDFQMFVTLCLEQNFKLIFLSNV